MGKIKKQIQRLQSLCSHPIIDGTGHDEGPWGFGSVSWKCDECGFSIKEDTILKKGTILQFYSTAKLKRTCKFSEIRDEDQEIILNKRQKGEL